MRFANHYELELRTDHFIIRFSTDAFGKKQAVGTLIMPMTVAGNMGEDLHRFTLESIRALAAPAPRRGRAEGRREVSGGWVRSMSGPRMVHWRSFLGVLLCSDAKGPKPKAVRPAELTSAGHPIGQVCELCRLRLRRGGETR